MTWCTTAAPGSGMSVSGKLVCVMYAPRNVGEYAYVVVRFLPSALSGGVLLASVPVSKYVAELERNEVVVSSQWLLVVRLPRIGSPAGGATCVGEPIPDETTPP